MLPAEPQRQSSCLTPTFDKNDCEPAAEISGSVPGIQTFQCALFFALYHATLNLLWLTGILRGEHIEQRTYLSQKIRATSDVAV